MWSFSYRGWRAAAILHARFRGRAGFSPPMSFYQTNSRALQLGLLCGFLFLAVEAWCSPEKPLIGLSLDTLKEERWQRDRDVFVAEAERLGAKVIVQSANSDDTRQVRDIESLISRGVDVLVVVAHNASAMPRAVKSANREKIPVVSYDRLILNADVACYISFDNVKVGEAQAAYAVERMPKDRPARIVRVYGAPTDHNARLFKAGQDNILLPLIAAGKIEVVFEDWAIDWRPEAAKKIMNAAIAKVGRQIDAVVASNDGTAGGVVQALLEEGLAGKVLVTGQDADLAACQRIQRGTQAMTVYKPVKDLAIRAARVAVEFAKGKAPATDQVVNNTFKDVPAILVPVVAVDRSNLEATILAEGFHTREQLGAARADGG
jgi:D-xylose transport system substrate-binding protein